MVGVKRSRMDHLGREMLCYGIERARAVYKEKKYLASVSIEEELEGGPPIRCPPSP